MEIYQIIFILAAAFLVASTARYVRLSPVLGYLLAGVLVGPHAFAVVENIHHIQAIAEFGVIFLLFTIGLEIPIERLRVMRRLVFGLGGTQVLVTGLIMGGIYYLFVGSLAQAIVLGGALALSSTALVVQTMVERGEISTLHGRAAFSTVLFQDLAVVPLIVVIPLLGMEGRSILTAVSLALANGFLVIVIVFLLGRLLLKPLFTLIDVRSHHELFTIASLLIVLGAAALSYYFGLSMALGAFLAGILLADSEYRHQVNASIEPFKGLLLGLFFMGVGMIINTTLLIDDYQRILGLLVGLSTLKALVLFIVGRLFMKGNIASLRYAILLSQGGEFVFVLLGIAATENIFPPDMIQMIFLLAALSMMLTPILIRVFFGRLTRWERDNFSKDFDRQVEEDADAAAARQNHVIIAGFGRVGRTVARVFDAEGVSFVAFDIDSSRVTQARARRRPVFFGDATRLPVWRSLGVADAASVVIAFENASLVSKVVSMLSQEFPGLKIFVRAADAQHAAELKAAGATASIPITFQASLELGATVLRSMNRDAHDVEQVISYINKKLEDGD